MDPFELILTLLVFEEFLDLAFLEFLADSIALFTFGLIIEDRLEVFAGISFVENYLVSTAGPSFRYFEYVCCDELLFSNVMFLVWQA